MTPNLSKSQVQLVARVGWAAKGGLYVTLGILAVMAAFGSGGQISGSKGVIQWLNGQTFGTVLLILVGLGFAAYALWRGAQTVLDPEIHASKKVMIAKRVGWTLSGLAHASLSVAAFQAVVGASSGSSKKMWIASVLQESWGPALIGTLGVFVIGVGFFQFEKSKNLAFLKDVHLREMSDAEMSALKIVGRVGLAARGVVFPIIGFFLVKSAWTSDASKVEGVGGALHELAAAGPIILAVVAAGLAAYGVLQLFFVRYRTVKV